MAVRCAYCCREKPRAALRRVRDRVLCGGCLDELGDRSPGPPGEDPAARLGDADRAAIRKLDLGLAFGGLLAKTVFFVAIFVWAGRSAVGAGALEGIVVADLLTWGWMTVASWQLRGAQVKWSAAFEVVLVLLFWNREALFAIPTDGTVLWATFSACLLYGAGKSALFYAETVLEVTGVSTT